MALFSERYGYTKASDVIIREKITPEIQNAICSCYDKLPDLNGSNVEHLIIILLPNLFFATYCNPLSIAR